MKISFKLSLALLLIILVSSRSYSQIRVWDNTTESVYGQVLIGSFASPADGHLNIQNTANDKKALYIRHLASIDGKQAIHINLNRNGSEGWVVSKDWSVKSLARGDGSIQAYYYYTLSDASVKKDITKLKDVKNQLFKLNGYSYFLTANENPKPKKEFGFVAQEVEQVFPEVVDTAFGGKKVLAYQALIPVVVEAMKEQQAEIDQLRITISDLTVRVEQLEKGALKGAMSPQTPAAEGLNEGPSLLQNSPNPFNESTTIKFMVPESCRTARLLVFDFNGVERKNVLINTRGNSELTINGSELVPGTYMYTLIVDGKCADTKIMILTAN